jgi:gliding motility-associated-like protein
MIKRPFKIKMKKYTALIFFSFISFFIKSQNLIPNGSFEILTTCPFESSQINLAPPWISATGNGTPDIYNECANNTPCCGVPKQGFVGEIGYQFPRTGKGYAGIYVYLYFAIDAFNEFIEVPLMMKLEKNKNYFVRFFTNSQNRPPKLGYGWTFTDAIGLAFSDTLFYKKNVIKQLKELTPVIENRGALIKDTVNWTPISGCYKATGKEKYAIIGNFRSESETLIEQEKKVSNPAHYMYIDDVEVVEFNPLPDTIILCTGQKKQLNARFLDGQYLWSTGSTDSIIEVTKPGLYIVGVTIDKCTMYDTVKVIDPKINDGILPDTTLCKGKPLFLKPNMIGKYEWSTGAQSETINVKDSGNYAVTVTNECGTFNYNAKVSFKDCGCNIYIPNAFSPNGDGLNDELKVYSGCDYIFKIKTFQIFDRWGELIFSESETNDIKWDGSFKGRFLTEGVFVWTLVYEVTQEGKTESNILSGNFTIMR